MPDAANERSLAALRDQLASIADEHLAGDDAALLCQLARPALRLAHGGDHSTARLGGGARLDPHQAWPRLDDRPLALLALVDLAEVSAFVVDVDLPTEGSLNVFYDAEEQSVWGFDPDDHAAWRVLMSSPDAVDVPPPPDAVSFPVVGLTGQQTLTIPGWEEPAAEPIFPPYQRRRTGFFGRRADAKLQRRRGAFNAVQEAWREIVTDAGRLDHQIGGWPVLQQGPIWHECDVVSRGYPLGNLEQSRAAERAGLPNTEDDWRLLIQIDSDDAAGWMWGDLGALYYAVRASQPSPQRFERCWMILQCG